jgi:hypothetical protein
MPGVLPCRRISPGCGQSRLARRTLCALGRRSGEDGSSEVVVAQCAVPARPSGGSGRAAAGKRARRSLVGRVPAQTPRARYGAAASWREKVRHGGIFTPGSRIGALRQPVERP